TDLAEGDVLFIDEIHRLGRAVEEILYPAMEDFQLDIVIGKGPAARSIRLDLPRFTLVGATTRTGLITGPLRDRFGFVARLDYYGVADLEAIVVRAASILGVAIDGAGAHEIARRARGTPRIATRLLRRVRDYAEVRGDGGEGGRALRLSRAGELPTLDGACRWPRTSTTCRPRRSRRRRSSHATRRACSSRSNRQAGSSTGASPTSPTCWSPATSSSST